MSRRRKEIAAATTNTTLTPHSNPASPILTVMQRELPICVTRKQLTFGTRLQGSRSVGTLQRVYRFDDPTLHRFGR